jgi:hypothetical protein
MSDADPSVTTPARPIRDAAKAGLSSARENLVPGCILWSLAAAIVAGFYLVPSVRAALDALGRLKVSGGFLYSAIATAIFGGVIPFLWRYATHYRSRSSGEGKPVPTSLTWKGCAFLSLLWAWKGVEIDLLYRGQALLFGTGATFAVVAPKVLVDQFVYNALWAAGFQAYGYWLLENDLRASAILDRAFWGSLGPRVLTVLISTWAVWIPMVCIIYSMPSNLQVPLFNIVLCFWSLMLASLTREKK